MKQYLKISLIGALVCCCFLGRAQETQVSAQLDTATIKLGDQTVLRLKARVPEAGQLTFPAVSDTLSAHIQLVEIGKIDTVKDPQQPGIWELNQAYTITSFEPGLQTVPSLTFQTANGDLKTDPLPLQVQAVAVDTTKAIYDIKQPLAVSYGFFDWLRDHILWVVLGVLALLVILLFWYYLKKRKKRAKPAEKPLPLLPAHVVALEKLQALRDKKLWQQGQVKTYYSELTDIIREFLEKRYGIHAMEQTSDEIFVALLHQDIPAMHDDHLRQLLQMADLVKFAKEQPLPEENEAVLEHAVRFVEGVGEKHPLTQQAKASEQDEHI